MQNPALHNPHLEGNPFFWEAGSVGVLLSHGYTATTTEVRLLGKRLHEKDYTVAGPLLAGHGTRPADLNQVSWRDWVDSAEKIYEPLASRCEQVFIGGESMGGLVALYLAIQHPQALGVLLYAPAIKLTLTSLDKIKLYIGSLFMAETPRSSLDSADKWQGYPGLPLKGAIQLLQMQDTVRKLLPKIKQPIVVFQGRNDMTVHPTAGDIILQGVNSSFKEHHWMERSTHAIMLDCELDAVTDLTLRFMDKVLKSK
jgi:carboxylesterase